MNESFKVGLEAFAVISGFEKFFFNILHSKNEYQIYNTCTLHSTNVKKFSYESFSQRYVPVVSSTIKILICECQKHTKYIF